ncbi:hypothetical protein O9G_000789 [Rozella allomycis CSF55]|uniref:Uncharacterized protein n=1 Tax=Rozella allomycis (strain CSF55) TaxID=988480 RepID=A0A075AW14_ROZAC|nr:hypothetical protein O9G_000789 [Rozella allomycis CSF55]|eukprot:EPZ32714.1 hypothetical protein O9G_000789 [Rozella allomycis CSF55]
MESCLDCIDSFKIDFLAHEIDSFATDILGSSRTMASKGHEVEFCIITKSIMTHTFVIDPHLSFHQLDFNTSESQMAHQQSKAYLLTEENYQVWKIRTQALLLHKKMWTHVITAPISELGKNDGVPSDSVQITALGLLLEQISEEVLPKFMNKLGSAYTLWNAIADEYTRSDPNKVGELHRQLDIHLLEGGSGPQFLASLQKIFERLSLLNAPIRRPEVLSSIKKTPAKLSRFRKNGGSGGCYPPYV